jgi:hypothetical protein
MASNRNNLAARLGKLDVNAIIVSLMSNRDVLVPLRFKTHFYAPLAPLTWLLTSNYPIS